MESNQTQELLDENAKLESKVVLALSRIAAKRKLARTNGVTCRQIVNYLNENYFALDGDIDSQVMTALLSCVKSGSVCALENGRYLLAGPGSKALISKCVARGTHGPKCFCVPTIKRSSRTFRNTCCLVKPSSSQSKKGKSATPEASDAEQPKKECKPKKCEQQQPKVINIKDSCTRRRATRGSTSKCQYCLEVHVVKRTSERLCKACHPVKTGFVAPYDKFSPREEVGDARKT